MKNFIVGLKKFLANKNTVTVLGTILIIAILYFGYNWRVNQAIKPVRMPYATETIQPRTKITEDMLGYVDVPVARLKGKVIKNASQIINKYSNVNTVIPSGSLFYQDTVVSFSNLPDASFVDIPEDMVPYYFKVSVDSTYGNSFYVGNYIDIYFKALDKDGKIMVGKLVENVKILAVKDSAGKGVFENTAEERVPASIIFAVPEKIHLMLRRAGYLVTQKVEIIPVPSGASYQTEVGAVTVTSTYIQEFIETYSTYIPEEIVPVVPPTPDQEKPVTPTKPDNGVPNGQ
ncbi:MAG: SAF domain-containing protein [Bacilli bacterium]